MEKKLEALKTLGFHYAIVTANDLFDEMVTSAFYTHVDAKMHFDEFCQSTGEWPHSTYRMIEL